MILIKKIVEGTRGRNAANLAKIHEKIRRAKRYTITPVPTGSTEKKPWIFQPLRVIGSAKLRYRNLDRIGKLVSCGTTGTVSGFPAIGEPGERKYFCCNCGVHPAPAGAAEDEKEIRIFG